MLKKAILFHLIPITIAIALSAILVYAIVLIASKTDKTVILDGTQTMTSGFFGNLTDGTQAEIDYFASLKNKEQITIFGSSEFSTSAYCPYNFLPDSLGIPAIGLGHAYHQNLSILCELLAADEYIENSKVCVILSLPWFATEGTNTSAFIEFVRPNLLNNIVQNQKIDFEYKQYIGKYINDHQYEMEGMTNNMEILQDLYLETSKNPVIYYKSKLRQYLKKISQRETVIYNLKLKSIKSKEWKGDFETRFQSLQNAFLKTATNNKIFVYDDYYSTYLLEKGRQRKGVVSKIDAKNNQELQDFYLLVQYLKSKNTACSFIIQPLNPYFYSNLENYNEIVAKITQTLDENKMPYLNMHVTKKADYDPGILSDIMHLGDYGWMKVNSFLKDTYHEN